MAGKVAGFTITESWRDKARFLLRDPTLLASRYAQYLDGKNHVSFSGLRLFAGIGKASSRRLRCKAFVNVFGEDN